MDKNDSQQLGRIEAKVDILLNRSENQENRLRAVERKQWWATGAAAVCGAVLANTKAFASIIGLH